MGEQYPLDRYGQWSGNPHGTPYNPDKCAYSVMNGYVSCQCSRKNGHGKDGLFCKQHAKKVQ